MQDQHEQVPHMDALPMRVFMHTVKTGFLHWHSDLELLLVLRGSVYVVRQDKTRMLREGELTVFSSGEIHATEQTSEPNHILGLQLDAVQCAPFDPTIESMQFGCFGGPAEHPAIAQLRHHMCTTMLERSIQQEGYQNRIMASIQEILSLLLQHFKVGENASLQALKKRDRERLFRVFQYVRENYQRRLTLQEVAEAESLSVNHLSSFFTKAARMNFSSYLNSVRLRAYTDLLQRNQSDTLDEISEACGFSSPQYAATLFKSTFHTSPGKYRRDVGLKSSIMEQSTATHGYLPIYQAVDLKLLKRYLSKSELPDTASLEPNQPECLLACGEKIGAYARSALRLTTLGRAYEGLLFPVQRALRRAKEELGFTHVRFHGIFNDEMMILRPDASGRIRYSWHLVDQLLDSLLDIGLKPFLETTFMPSLLASGTQTVFVWKGNITPPRDMKLWYDLVHHFARHLLERYGEEEVNTWFFEAWNEPDLADIAWSGSQQDFFQLYEATARALTAVLPKAQLCGPSICGNTASRKAWIQPFLRFVKKEQLPHAAFTLHCYPEDLETCDLTRLSRQSACEEIIDEDEIALLSQDYVSEQVAAVRMHLSPLLPLVVTEWNVTQLVFNGINDTPYAATSLLHSALRSDHRQVWLAHWTLTDLMQEHPLPGHEFHGGFGLLTISGVPKMTYWALWALARLYPEVVARDGQTIVTRQDGQYAILRYTHPELPQAYDPRPLSLLGRDFAPSASAKPKTLVLQGLPDQAWLVEQYTFSTERDACSLWQTLGMGSPLTPREAAHLSAASAPEKRYTHAQSEGGQLRVQCQEEPCGFALILLAGK